MGALRHFDRFARRLERELDVQPSAKLRDLAESLRNSLTARGREAGSGRARDRPTVAILPFSYNGQPAYDYLRTGLAELLATAMDGSESLRCVDPGSLSGWMAQHHAATDAIASRDEELCRSAGERFDASHCVTGRIVESGGRLRVRASVITASNPSIVLATVAAEDLVAELFSLADRLAVSLLVEVASDSIDGRPRQLALLTTDSLPALKCYLDGEVAFRAGRFTIAADAFQRATVLDPTFALGHYRLAVVSEWLGAHLTAAEAASTAVAHMARLSTHDRRLLMAFDAFLGGDAALAESLYQEALAIHPESAEAWLHLARVRFFLDSLRGRPMTGAAPALEQAAQLDPGNIVVLLHATSIAAKQRQRAEVEAISARVLKLLGQSDHMNSRLLVRLLRAHSTGDMLEQERLWPELEASSDVTLFWAFTLLSVTVNSMAASGTILELMTRVSRPRAVRLFGHLSMAALETGRDRWSEARDQLDMAAQLDPRSAMVHRGLLTVACRARGRENLMAVRDGLLHDEQSTEPVPHGHSSFPFHVSGYREAMVTVRNYVIGMVHQRLGEPEAALQRARMLETGAGALPLGALARDCARGIRAAVSHEQGDDRHALAVLESCELTAPMYLYASSAFHGRLEQRYLRAELLAAAGRDDEALSWYASLSEDSPFGFLYLVPASGRRAELLERRGDVASAVAVRGRLAGFWETVDGGPGSSARPVATRRGTVGYSACWTETVLASRTTAADHTLEEQMKKKSPRGIPDFSRKPHRDKDGKLPEAVHVSTGKTKRGPQPSHVLPKGASSKSGQRGQ